MARSPEILTVEVTDDARTTELEGWTEVRVSRGVETAASDFEVSVSTPDPDQAQARAVPIKPAARVRILLGGEPVLDGYVDDVKQSYGPTRHRVAVSGRSRTQDLVDCSVLLDGGELRQQSPLSIARQLAAPYSVDVRLGQPALNARLEGGLPVVPGLDPVPRFDVESGEKVADTIEKLASMRGLLVTDDVDGALVLTAAPEAPDAIQPIVSKPGNVKTGQGRFDVSERYTEYRCRGQRAGGDLDFGDVVVTPEGRAADPSLDRLIPFGRDRVRVVEADEGATPQTCRQRAVYEAATRAGQSTALTYTVRGWRDQAGRLWRPNTLVWVDDETLRVRAEMLVVELTYQRGEKGSETELQLAPPQGYRLREPDDVDEGIGQWTGVLG